MLNFTASDVSHTVKHIPALVPAAARSPAVLRCSASYEEKA